MLRLNHNGLKKINLKRRENIAHATHELLENDDIDAADKALRRAKLSQELQVQYGLLSSRRLIPSLFFLLCLCIVTVLWLVPYPHPRVHLDLEVETAVFRLAEHNDFIWHENGGLKIDRFSVDGHFTVNAPGIESGINEDGERLLLEGSKVTLKQLTIRKGARLEIERDHDGISLYIYEGGTQCQVEIHDGTLRLQGKNNLAPVTIDSPVPETLRLSSGSSNIQHRLHLRMKTRADWKLYGLQVTGMSFQQELPSEPNNFISSIRSGIIKLPEVEGKEELLDHDWLHTRKAVSTRLVLNFFAKEIDHFDLMFQGYVQSIQAGPDDFEQELTPSLLAWIYYQKQLAFYWGALLFVYGLLTNLRAFWGRQ